MYKSEIINTSLENMSKVELVAMKDVTDCILLERFLEDNGEEVIIEVADFVELHVQNDKSESKEYDVLIIVDKNGQKYKTGSDSFKRAFLDIFSELHGESGWAIKVFGKPSKNYNGKNFLTCSVVTI